MWRIDLRKGASLLRGYRGGYDGGRSGGGRGRSCVDGDGGLRSSGVGGCSGELLVLLAKAHILCLGLSETLREVFYIVAQGVELLDLILSRELHLFCHVSDAMTMALVRGSQTLTVA